MGHPATPLSPMGSGGLGSVPHMDGWVLEETKKLEAQQRIQQRKLLDLKQVCACVRAGMRRLECFTHPQIVPSKHGYVCLVQSPVIAQVLPVMCVLVGLLCVCVHWAHGVIAGLIPGDSIPCDSCAKQAILSQCLSANGLCLHLYHLQMCRTSHHPTHHVWYVHVVQAGSGDL